MCFENKVALWFYIVHCLDLTISMISTKYTCQMELRLFRCKEFLLLFYVYSIWLKCTFCRGFCSKTNIIIMHNVINSHDYILHCMLHSALILTQNVTTHTFNGVVLRKSLGSMVYKVYREPNFSYALLGFNFDPSPIIFKNWLICSHAFVRKKK